MMNIGVYVSLSDMVSSACSTVYNCQDMEAT